MGVWTHQAEGPRRKVGTRLSKEMSTLRKKRRERTSSNKKKRGEGGGGSISIGARKAGLLTRSRFGELEGKE